MILPLAAAAAGLWAWHKFKGPPTLDVAKFSDPRAQFVAKVVNAASKPCQAADVPLSLAVAQAAVETGWGKAVPGGNLFGLKGRGPAGVVNVPTKEEGKPGEVTRIRADFRAFTNWTQSVEAWCRYVTAPRNRPPVAGASAGSWLVWYWSQGYATAARYPAAVASVSRRAAQLVGRPDLAVALSPAVAQLANDLGQLDPKARRAKAKALAAAKAWPA